MALGSKRFMDTRFLTVGYRPLELFTSALVEIFPDSKVSNDTWNPNTGVTKVPVDPVYKGWASLTPNKDWRARNRVWGDEATAMHAYRVQLWHIDRNLLVPEEDWGKPGLRVKFGEGMRVLVVENNADPRSVGLKLIIRNAVTDDTFWQPTLLCDMDTGDTRL